MKDFIEFLDKRIEEGRVECARLSADGRKDDANFVKVRTNIFEVCKTVSQTLANRPGAGVAAIRAQFSRFRTIWGASLEKAKQHEDVGTVAVEETKLAALEEVVTHFEEVTEA